MAKNSRDSRRENKLITGCYILIDIYKGEYKVRGKIYGKPLNEGQQKTSTRLSNRIIVRQGCKTNIITIFRNLGPLAKAEQGVF